MNEDHIQHILIRSEIDQIGNIIKTVSLSVEMLYENTEQS